MLFCAVVAANEVPAPKPVVVAYVFAKDRVIQPTEVDPTKIRRINYAFANIQTGRMVEGYASDPTNFAALTALKKTNPSLAVLVSVGGWLWSDNFSDMALTRKSRRIFLDSVVPFLQKYNLDGLDIDWEYPGLPGWGHRFRVEDNQNFTALLKDARRRFDKEEHRLHRHLYLTIATGASAQYLANTEMAKVQKYVDTVNLMAYDYYEPSADPVAGHHAPLFTNPDDPKHISADGSVQEYEQAGVPASKIVLGVPFYGHVWGNVADAKHGLYQAGKSVPNVYARYSDISAGTLGNGFTRYWDSVASVPYLYDPAKQMFVSYEDPESLALKCKYILDHKLAGIMFWEYFSDPSGALLDAIDRALLSAPAATAK